MAHPRFVLVVQVPNGETRELSLDVPVVIGRDASADVRVADKRVSRRHASIRLVEGQARVDDLGSSNGVRLNGTRIDGSARFGPGDEVRVGGCVCRLVVADSDQDPTSALHLDALPGQSEGTGPMVRAVPAASGVGRGASRAFSGEVLVGESHDWIDERMPLASGENVLGRIPECDFVFDQDSVSRQHARITVHSPQRISIEDLGSANGVFLEGVRILRATLEDGDRISLGQVDFRVELARAPARRPARERMEPVEPPRAPVSPFGVVLGVVAVLLAGIALALALFVGRWDALEPVMDRAQAWLGVQTSTPSEWDPRSDETEVARAPRVEAPVVMPEARSHPEGAESPPPVAPPQPPAPTPRSEPLEAAMSNAVLDPAMAGRPFAEAVVARTATAPWTPRGPDGLPRSLPPVNPSFDHAGWVEEAVTRADAALEAGDRLAAAAAAKDLARVDPIHPRPALILARVAELEAADEALARADVLVAKKEVAEAWAILAHVPPELPQAAAARARADELKPRALEDALARARAVSKGRSGYQRAHRFYSMAIELDPSSDEARTAIRALERKMRKAGVAYGPARATNPSQAQVDERSPLEAMYGPDAGVVKRYLEGKAPAAVTAAKRSLRKLGGERKARLRRFIEAAESVQKRFRRVRTEIPNDPSRAWAQLLELERIEAAVLPDGVKSYLTLELRADLSDAFARQGERMLEEHRHEAAFQRFEAGYKLDERNPRVDRGLARVAEVAEGLAEQGRVAARRGAKAEACERFREVSRLTRGGHALHAEAVERARKLCP